MTLRDLAIKYEGKIKELEAARKNNALIIAGDMVALVINRVQNTGIDADGNKYDKYSQNPLPLFYFGDGNAPSKAAKFKKDAAKKKVDPTYENFRKALGLPTDKRTLTVTGDMFRSIRQEITEHNLFVTVVEIRAKDKFNQNKVNWNSGDVGGSILRPNAKEKEMVSRANQKRLASILSA